MSVYQGYYYRCDRCAAICPFPHGLPSKDDAWKECVEAGWRLEDTAYNRKHYCHGCAGVLGLRPVKLSKGRVKK